MSTAAKLRKKAAELEQQKQYEKAVQAYKRALEDEQRDGDEPDVQLYNRIGDLLIRQGSVAEAVTYLEKAVDLYTASDLHNNAIALCNKILRHTPGRSGVYHTLGRICARKGLRGDATRNFVEYAARMQQAGRSDEALAALVEFVDLVPANSELRALLDAHMVATGRVGQDTSDATGASISGLTVIDVSGASTAAPVAAAGASGVARPPAPAAAQAVVGNAPVAHSPYVVKPQPPSELIFLSVEFDAPTIPALAPRTSWTCRDRS
jgi:tetratricopeptide (TPR) repeat protein